MRFWRGYILREIGTLWMPCFFRVFYSFLYIFPYFRSFSPILFSLSVNIRGWPPTIWAGR